jgi:Peptidase inhibitor family I36
VDRSRLVIPLAVASLWIAVPVDAQVRAACPDGAACVWTKKDFRGSRAQIPPRGCIDSNIRSAVNGTDRVLQFFLSGGCAGVRVGHLEPGQESARISAGSATGDCTNSPVDQCSGDTETPEVPVP